MQTRPSPREFLKARRPERFSDSSVEPVSEVDRGILEYHLESLTSRSQETQFENFARALIKLEICPNILPQTGPTGGGDSKVDSETYPVADSLALAWYSGLGRKSAGERWAFAVSAKAKWTSKLKSDLAKIAATNRGYKQAFFVTNQYVRDKQRGELEDDLRETHEFDVRILDRTWILDVVFDHGRQEVAIQELGVSPSIRRQVHLGPLDLQREAELTRLEKRIEANLANETICFVLVDDCIDSAIISRELERPSTETLGRFERADNIAAECGTQHQRIRCAYEQAWTSFFWFEDIAKFTELYAVVEGRAIDSSNIYDLELLTNLWMLLHVHAQDPTSFEHHTRALKERLNTFAGNDEFPTTALQAQAFLLKLQLTCASRVQKPVDSYLREFSKIIKKSESLVGFPLLPLADTLIALNGSLGEMSGYEALHDQLVEVVARRKGEVEGARLLLQRSEQQLDADCPVDAIRSIGKALHRLAKEESRSAFCRALYACGCAYERIGLLWAARGSILTAASISISDLWKYEDVTPFQAICFRRLKWIELQLGRVPYVLSWHEVDVGIRGVLLAQGYDEAKLREGSEEFDAIFGILLLKTEFWELKDVVRLPDRLSSMGLHSAAVALRYALGHEDEFTREMVAGSNSQDSLPLFVKWRDQPAGEDLPEAPDLCNQAKLGLRSSVLGCAITVTMPNEAPFAELGESFLAAMESTLATGLVRRIGSRIPTFTVTIKPSDFCNEPVEFFVDEDSGYPHLTVMCRSFDADTLNVEQQHELKERIAEMVAQAVIGYIVIADEQDLEQLFRDDSALSRAIDFSGSFQVLGNVLGHDRKRHLSSWIQENAQDYSVRRERAWDADCPSKTRRGEPFTSSAEPGSRRPGDAEVSRRLQTLRHSRVKTLSLIRDSLWNKAEWQGMGVAVVPDSTPVLALIFNNREPAKRIFSFWKEELGKTDEAEALRISIIRYVDRRHPHHYRVMVGPNLEEAELEKGDTCFAVSRVQQMTPETSDNLDSFLQAYRDVGAYFVAPAVVDASGKYPESIGDFDILKRKLTVKDAWTVGLDVPEAAGILPDDRPVIPDDVNDPPIEKLLETIRSRREANPHQVPFEARSTSSRMRKEKRKKEKQKRQRARRSRRRK